MSHLTHGAQSYWLVVLSVHGGIGHRIFFLQYIHKMHFTASQNSSRDTSYVTGRNQGTGLFPSQDQKLLHRLFIRVQLYV